MSLLLDAQGKTYAQYLLATEVEVEAGLLDGVDEYSNFTSTAPHSQQTEI